METRECLCPTCEKAGHPQPLEDFGLRKKGYLGRKSWCRQCCAKQRRANYEARQRDKSRDGILEFRDTGERFQLTGRAITAPYGGCKVVYKGKTSVCQFYRACEASAARGGPVRCEEVAVETKGEMIFIW